MTAPWLVWFSFPPQPCLCGGTVTEEEAETATVTDDKGRTIFAGWRHPECVRL